MRNLLRRKGGPNAPAAAPQIQENIMSQALGLLSQKVPEDIALSVVPVQIPNVLEEVGDIPQEDAKQKDEDEDQEMFHDPQEDREKLQDPPEENVLVPNAFTSPASSSFVSASSGSKREQKTPQNVTKKIKNKTKKDKQSSAHNFA